MQFAEISPTKSAKRAENMTYIHQIDGWPNFSWQEDALATKLADVRHRQGRLIGKMEGLGFKLREEAVLRTLTDDVVKSSDIEGETLDKDQVRSSIARRLGMDVAGLIPSERNVEGVVEMMLDATQNYTSPLTKDRLFGWHAALFPTGRSGMSKIIVGNWRDDSEGPMQVVSGPYGKEHVHYEAPKAVLLPEEMDKFLDWIESKNTNDPVINAAIAHLWFVTIHPFEDGNGRIARAIADLALARSENSNQRFYSMSSQIRAERNQYYEVLEHTQKGDLDISDWLHWFLDCLDRAINQAEQTLAAVIGKAKFWETANTFSLNDRQRAMLNRLLDGFEGKLTSTKWAKITKSSQDTASRDIKDLMEKGLMIRGPAGGRSTSYELAQFTE